MDRAFEFVIGAACLVIIVAGGIYIADHIHCFNFFGLAKGCVIGK